MTISDASRIPGASPRSESKRSDSSPFHSLLTQRRARQLHRERGDAALDFCALDRQLTEVHAPARQRPRQQALVAEQEHHGDGAGLERGRGLFQILGRHGLCAWQHAREEQAQVLADGETAWALQCRLRADQARGRLERQAHVLGRQRLCALDAARLQHDGRFVEIALRAFEIDAGVGMDPRALEQHGRAARRAFRPHGRQCRVHRAIGSRQVVALGSDRGFEREHLGFHARGAKVRRGRDEPGRRVEARGCGLDVAVAEGRARLAHEQRHMLEA